MPLAQRRPAFLKLTLPHPPLSCLPPNVSNATTTQKPNPITPVNPRRDSYNVPGNRASVDSWGSSLSNDSSSMAAEYEWTPAQIQIIRKTLDNLPSHLFTPYVGAVPPQNILQKLARGVKDARGPVDWPHSQRATRQMLHKVAVQLAITPPKMDVSEKRAGSSPPVDATNSPRRERNASGKVPLYRKNSMDDLLPEEAGPQLHRSTKENVEINRASTRLQQRADKFFTFHPYADSRQRHSVVSTTTANSDPISGFRAPMDTSLSSPVRRPLRRTASSTSSQLATVDEGFVPIVMTPLSSQAPPSAPSSGHLLSSIAHRTSNPSIQRIRRSDSFQRPLSMGATIFAGDNGTCANSGERGTLKRAPSYGAVAQQKKEDQKKRDHYGVNADGKKSVSPQHVTPTSKTRPNSPGVYSSDEEEKRRAKSSKRLKMVHRKPSFLGGELHLKSEHEGLLPSARAQPQTITVEEFTLASSGMASMDSLPSLSTSSSVTQLSMRSVATVKTRASSKSSPSRDKSKTTTKGKSKAKEIIPPVPALPTTPQPGRATSLSPVRTLRRVGNKPLKLESISTSAILLSPPLPSRPQSSSKPNDLSGIGRKISFGTMNENPTSSSTSMLGGALSLSSPFEEVRPEPMVKAAPSASRGNKIKSAMKYLF